jgi:hypothetical protein
VDVIELGEEWRIAKIVARQGDILEIYTSTNPTRNA